MNTHHSQNQLQQPTSKPHSHLLLAPPPLPPQSHLNNQKQFQSFFDPQLEIPRQQQQHQLTPNTSDTATMINQNHPNLATAQLHQQQQQSTSHNHFDLLQQPISSSMFDFHDNLRTSQMYQQILQHSSSAFPLQPNHDHIHHPSLLPFDDPRLRQITGSNISAENTTLPFQSRFALAAAAASTSVVAAAAAATTSESGNSGREISGNSSLQPQPISLFRLGNFPTQPIQQRNLSQPFEESKNNIDDSLDDEQHKAYLLHQVNSSLNVSSANTHSSILNRSINTIVHHHQQQQQQVHNNNSNNYNNNNNPSINNSLNHSGNQNLNSLNVSINQNSRANQSLSLNPPLHQSSSGLVNGAALLIDNKNAGQIDNNDHNEEDVDDEFHEKDGNSTRVYVCQQSDCNKAFKSKQLLIEHQQIHQNIQIFTWYNSYLIYKNTYLPLILAQKRDVESNSRCYTAFKSIARHTVALVLINISNLKRHMKVHLNEKPYECEVCQKTFTTASNLKQHQLTHDNQGQRERYVCHISECGKSYLYSSSLKKHMKEHLFNNMQSQILQQQQISHQPASQNRPQQQHVVQNNIYSDNEDDEDDEEQHPIQAELLPQQQQIQQQQIGALQQSASPADNPIERKHSARGQEPQVLPFLIQSSQQNDSMQNKLVEVKTNIGYNQPSIRVNAEDISILSSFFQTQQLALQHDGHFDVLFNGYLYCMNKLTGKLEIHEVQTIDAVNDHECHPLPDATHHSSEEIGRKLNEIEYRYQGASIFESACSALSCNNPGSASAGSQKGCGCNSGESAGKNQGAGCGCGCACKQKTQDDQNKDSGATGKCCGNKAAGAAAITLQTDKKTNSSESSGGSSGCCGSKKKAQVKTEEVSKADAEPVSKCCKSKAISQDKPNSEQNLIPPPPPSSSCCSGPSNTKKSSERSSGGCCKSKTTDASASAGGGCCGSKKSNGSSNSSDFCCGAPMVKRWDIMKLEDQLEMKEVKLECTCGCEQNCLSCLGLPSAEDIHTPTSEKQVEQQCCSTSKSAPLEQKQAVQHEQQQQQQYSMEIEKELEKIIRCICSETQDMKHKHGPGCGHTIVMHNGHMDYLVHNQLHHPHGNHCDYHGTVKLLEYLPKS